MSLSHPVAFPVVLDGIGEAHIAAWVFPPDGASDASLSSPWLLCVPGATYRGLAYYDRQVPGFPPAAYSMARFFALQGIGVVVIDLPGTGASRVDADGTLLTPAVVADALRQVAAQLRARLCSGTLLDRLPALDASRLLLIGVGHSLGGCLLSQAQAAHACCDGLMLLGVPGRMGDMQAPFPGTGMPADEMMGLWLAQTEHGYVGQMPAALHSSVRVPLRPFFSSSSVPDALIAADEADAVPIPLGLLAVMQDAVIARAARRIACPLLLAFGGAVDVTDLPHAEPAAYPAACSITLVVVPGAAHCATFEPGRVTLWQQMAAWAGAQARLARDETTPAGALAVV